MVRTRFAAIHPFHQRPLSQFANVLTLTLNGTNKICFPRSACLFIFFGLLSFFPVSKATQQKLEWPSKLKLSCTSNAQTTLSISKKPRLPNALGSFTSGCFFALLPGPFLTVLSILLPIFTANNFPHTCKLVVEHTREHTFRPPSGIHAGALCICEQRELRSFINRDDSLSRVHDLHRLAPGKCCCLSLYPSRGP